MKIEIDLSPQDIELLEAFRERVGEKDLNVFITKLIYGGLFSFMRSVDLEEGSWRGYV